MFCFLLIIVKIVSLWVKIVSLTSQNSLCLWTSLNSKENCSRMNRNENERQVTIQSLIIQIFPPTLFQQKFIVSIKKTRNEMKHENRADWRSCYWTCRFLAFRRIFLTIKTNRLNVKSSREDSELFSESIWIIEQSFSPSNQTRLKSKFSVVIPWNSNSVKISIHCFIGFNWLQTVPQPLKIEITEIIFPHEACNYVLQLHYSQLMHVKCCLVLIMSFYFICSNVQ